MHSPPPYSHYLQRQFIITGSHSATNHSTKVNSSHNLKSTAGQQTGQLQVSILLEDASSYRNAVLEPGANRTEVGILTHYATTPCVTSWHFCNSDCRQQLLATVLWNRCFARLPAGQLLQLLRNSSTCSGLALSFPARLRPIRTGTGAGIQR